MMCPSCGGIVAGRCPVCNPVMESDAHGTVRGYQRHRRAGETPCGNCKRAKSRYVARWRDANPDSRSESRARNRAVRMLKERYPVEFASLIATARRSEGLT